MATPRLFDAGSARARRSVCAVAEPARPRSSAIWRHGAAVAPHAQRACAHGLMADAAGSVWPQRGRDLDPRIRPRAHSHGGPTTWCYTQAQPRGTGGYALPAGSRAARYGNAKPVTIVLVVSPTGCCTPVRLCVGRRAEDPATGAATAALAGYLRDPATHGGAIDVVQGEDMACTAPAGADRGRARQLHPRVGCGAVDR